MPRVFRQQYTRPIPDAAERLTRKGKPAVRFKGPDGKPIVAPLTRKGDRCRVASPVWYGHIPDEDAPDGRRRVPLCANKAAAEIMLGELCRKAEMGQAGACDPFEEHRKRPLLEHVADYRLELEARGNEPRYVRLVVSRLNALCEGCGFRSTADLSASRVMVWLASLRRPQTPAEPLPDLELFTRNEAAAALGLTVEAFRDAVIRHRLPVSGQGRARRFPRATVEAVQRLTFAGHSIRTTNYYLSHFKSFCRWLIKDDRLDPRYDPREQLTPGNVEVDHRHDRRELTTEELRRLLAAARLSERVFRGLSGEDRFHLYATACGTGFRAAALASLTPERFSLDRVPPVVYLSAKRNKSRKLKEQPLADDLTALLLAYLRDRPAGLPVWGGTWAKDWKAAEMLRLDLEAAGIPYTVEGPDGPLFADFHSLRHTYLTALFKGGVDLRTAQELAGHSTPRLTARYTHVRLSDQAGAVGRLPKVLPAAEEAAPPATGTDG